MQTFIEDATYACAGADVAALILLSGDAQDVEFWLLQPEDVRVRRPWTPPAEFIQRKLRIIGCVGLHGCTPRFCFKESLPLSVFMSCGAAFAGYVQKLSAEIFSEPARPEDWLN